MSIMRSPVDIQCDTCGQWVAGGHTARESRQLARKLGWKLDGRSETGEVRDVCLRCIKARSAAEASG